MRLFVALQPPAAALEHLGAAVGLARAAVSDDVALRWTPADRWHVTLTFCGEVDAKTVPILGARLARAVARSHPLTLRFAGSGAFSRPAHATVLWTGIAGHYDELRRLADRTSAAARRSGIAVDDRKFRPHLTVARCSRPADLRSLVDALAEYDGPPWRADAVHLVHSGTAAGGPVYRALSSYPMRLP